MYVCMYVNMQYIGSLTARPIKNYYVFKLQQLSGHIISKKKKINKNKIKYKKKQVIIIKYMHGKYSDQSVHAI